MESGLKNVIIVDSGVDMTHPILQEKNIHGRTLDFKSGELKVYNEISDDNGHGTAITGIIARESWKCNILVLRIRGEDEAVSCDELIKALKYIYGNCSCDVLNLSLGITFSTDIDELCEICQNIAEEGTIIVSAFDNAGSISYPAACKSVIGVTSGIHCNTVNELEYFEDEILNIGAYGKTQRVAWLDHSYIMFGGNSFACAHITAKVVNLMYDGYTSKADIMQKLCNMAAIRHKKTNETVDHTLNFSIKKAILFPFNKEMHSLVRYNRLLPFSIEGVYDSWFSGNIGVNTQSVLENCDSEFIICNINSIDWEEFDTLILGHIDKLRAFSRISKEIEKILEQAILKKKCIYSFDIEIEKKIGSYDNLFVPSVKKENLPIDRCGKLYRVSKPVIGIFGTSSSQGKFSLQLILREKFLMDGYQVGQIGSEPQSLLFGFDYVYPMGYESSVFIEGIECIRYLNTLLKRLEYNDIILVGSQSGTVPYDYGNIAQYNIPQNLFLLGTLPDIVCLCINVFDEIDYIRRTIAYIESVSKSEVIALVLFPMGITESWKSIYNNKCALTQEELDTHKEKISVLLDLPVYILGKMTDMDDLYHYIIDYFTE